MTPSLPARSSFSPLRALAVGSVGLVVVAYLSVLTFVANVTGDPETLYLMAGGMALAGAVVAKLTRPRYALVAAVAILGAGAWLYLDTLPANAAVAGALAPVVADSVSLLTGLSILRIINADVWALAVVPAPTFLAAYLAVRRRYVAGAGVAGATLAVFVLTGDATPPITLLGAVGVAGAMGFGDLARRGAGLDRAETVAIVLAVLVVVPLAVSVVPGGSASPITAPGTGTGSGGDTVEGSLVGGGSSLSIQGSIRLSPEVRFRVRSGQPSYWRVGSFDRYTGQGWVRTGDTRRLEGDLSMPPGPSRRLEQRFTALGQLNAMPAAWRPRSVQGSPAPVEVVGGLGLEPAMPLQEGDTYGVVSQVPAADPQSLREAGTDYPGFIEERYTQLPASTPDRVAERTGRIAANAENPYDTARVIERWLQNNRGYSLDVNRPNGDIADAFLFEMRRGYCTYFATTMVTMLRTQGVPARMVVGYTPGERVAENEWVTRGLDSHAWVEVYFPDHGWIRFDPTPSGPRQTAEETRLSQARQNNESDVDTDGTGPGGWTPTPEPTPTVATPDGDPGSDNRTRTPRLDEFGPAGTAGSATPAGGFGVSPGGGDEGGGLPELPSREEAALLAVVAVGAAAAVRRTGLDDRAYRAVWLRVQPRADPETDVRRAWERLEHVLGRRERPRRPGETVRRYVDAVGDPEAERLADIYERAVYAGDASTAEADEAVAIADRAVSSLSPLPWR